MDPTARANELIELTTALTEVIDQENEMLKTHQVGLIADLQSQKTSLADLYEMRLREASQDPAALDTLEPTLRDRLREVSEAFGSSARRNAYALRAAMELNNQIVQTIAQSVEDQRVSSAGYTNSGAAPTSGDGSLSTNEPMTLDKQF